MFKQMASFPSPVWVRGKQEKTCFILSINLSIDACTLVFENSTFYTASENEVTMITLFSN